MFSNPVLLLLGAALLAFLAQWLLLSSIRNSIDGQPIQIDDGRLECRHCSAVNAADYRFCRNCVAELQPHASTVPFHSPNGRSPLP